MRISLEECLSLIKDSNSEKNRVRGIKFVAEFVEQERLVGILQRVIRDDNSIPVINSAIRVLGNSFRGTGDSSLSSYFADLVSNDNRPPEVRRYSYFAFLKILDVRPNKSFRSIEEIRSAGERVLLQGVLLQVKTTGNFDPTTDVDWSLVNEHLPQLGE